MPSTTPPVVAPELVKTKTRTDECYLLEEENQRAVATWCGGSIGIHGVGVFVTSLDRVIPLGEWLVKEIHHDGSTRWQSYEPGLFAQLYQWKGTDDSGE